MFLLTQRLFCDSRIERVLFEKIRGRGYWGRDVMKNLGKNFCRRLKHELNDFLYC